MTIHHKTPGIPLHYKLQHVQTCEMSSRSLWTNQGKAPSLIKTILYLPRVGFYKRKKWPGALCKNYKLPGHIFLKQIRH